MTADDTGYHMLSDDECAELDRAKRNRALCCADGMCGGCPRCGYFPAEPPEEEEEADESWRVPAARPDHPPLISGAHPILPPRWMVQRGVMQ